MRILLLLLVVWLSGCATRGPSSTGPTPPPAASAYLPEARLESEVRGLAEPAIQAFSLVGTPYKWGGNTPASGFDCSGLVVYVMQRSLGARLPRTVDQMSRVGREIDAADRLPGDLVFFNTTGETYSHVGIYIGQNRFVHAPAKGGTVRLESLISGYWGPRITGFRRVGT
ncbi:MAG: hypothetical protein RL133_516 [Pseudomonadota bacterium]